MATGPTFKPASEWTQAEAESFAAVYASTHPDISAQVSADEKLRKALAEYMDLNGLEELVDGETGQGVHLGKARKATRWDVEHMPATVMRKLAGRGLLTVVTTAFDALRKDGAGASDLDAAVAYRIDGETARPVEVNR